MNPSVLFVIGGDPRTSPRPAEAIRIAAGVGAWKKSQVSVYLRDAAVLALGEYVDELVDEDHYNRYMPILGEFGRPVYVQAENPFLSELGEPRVRFERVPDAQLATFATRFDYLLHF